LDTKTGELSIMLLKRDINTLPDSLKITGYPE
jgi:hypothetical protein